MYFFATHDYSPQQIDKLYNKSTANPQQIEQVEFDFKEFNLILFKNICSLNQVECKDNCILIIK